MVSRFSLAYHLWILICNQSFFMQAYTLISLIKIILYHNENSSSELQNFLITFRHVVAQLELKKALATHLDLQQNFLYIQAMSRCMGLRNSLDTHPKCYHVGHTKTIKN